ncbi:hypothetical protein [Nocardioides sp. W7]|uniref:hypothetical protein n=1 Tax=Nocardioides sp. W7 TaxID=2931390 RepID=UPI001FD5E9B3|nr:hypothetical protein [Nocardioides sp. W7]
MTLGTSMTHLPRSPVTGGAPGGSVPDALIGAVSTLADGLRDAGRLGVRVGRPGARLLLDPPFLPASRRPVRLVEALARRGRVERAAARRSRDRLLAAALPGLVEYLADLVPFTDLVRRALDLDALVAGVDLDTVVAKVDLDAVVAKVDLDAVVAKVDLDAVAARIDIDAILQRIDLTHVVTEQADLDAIARTIDLDAVIARVDLAALANEVIAAIDLPEIIRESSGSLASETVRSVRMQSIDADRAVQRVIDRLRRHRHLESGDGLPGGAAT